MYGWLNCCELLSFEIFQLQEFGAHERCRFYCVVEIWQVILAYIISAMLPGT